MRDNEREKEKERKKEKFKWAIDWNNSFYKDKSSQ
jgi:hypothetical protein